MEDVTIEVEVIRVRKEYESGRRYLTVRLLSKNDELEVGEEFGLKGIFPPCKVGHVVLAFGSWEEDPKYGMTFEAKTVMQADPTTLEGVVKHLASNVEGIGFVTAKRIVHALGMDTLKVLYLEETSSAIARLSKLVSLETATQMVVLGRKNRSREQATAWLQGHAGLSPLMASRVWEQYEDEAMGTTSADPYRLAVDILGIGFVRADEIAFKLGVPKTAPTRFRAGLLHCLSEAESNEGHCFLWKTDLFERTTKLLFDDEEDPDPDFEVEFDVQLPRALEALTEESSNIRVVVERLTDGRELVFRESTWLREESVASQLSKLILSRPVLTLRDDPAVLIAEFERRMAEEVGKPWRLDETQREAVLACVESCVFILTGGPGTGKTTILRALLWLFCGDEKEKVAPAVQNSEGRMLAPRELPSIAKLMAPTGRASKVISEVTGHVSRTIHRRLGAMGEGEFTRKKSNPIQAKVILVDEVSMVPLHLFESLLSAIEPGTRVVFVGDSDQLPSVECGAVLRDLLKSERMVFRRLEHIHRQAEGSAIVRNAHHVIRGECIEEDSRSDFLSFRESDLDRAVEILIRGVQKGIPERLAKMGILSAEVQILVPMRVWDTGTLALNERLQRVFNPSDGRKGMTRKIDKQIVTFYEGDKVIHTKNDYSLGVMNGEIGRVQRVFTNAKGLEVLEVLYDPKSPETERWVEYSKLDHLELAYAITIHKAQGSEYPAVIVLALGAHTFMLSRNLLYTAITRGRKLVVFVHDPKAVKTGLRFFDRQKVPRQTRLVARLRRAMDAALALR